jgi:hypothetical protein
VCRCENEKRRTAPATHHTTAHARTQTHPHACVCTSTGTQIARTRTYRQAASLRSATWTEVLSCATLLWPSYTCNCRYYQHGRASDQKQLVAFGWFLGRTGSAWGPWRKAHGGKYSRSDKTGDAEVTSEMSRQACHMFLAEDVAGRECDDTTHLVRLHGIHSRKLRCAIGRSCCCCGHKNMRQ